MKKPSLTDRLLAKLQKLGLTERKATELAKGLAPTANRAKVTGTVTGKLTDRLVALGLSDRKAKALATGLAPVVRASIKAKAKAAQVSLDTVDDAFVNEIVKAGVDLSEDADLDVVAPRVNGHRVRLDLPVIARDTWQQHHVTGVELLRVMDGLTTEATYLVAAVKGAQGLVAIRQLSENYYNVKFYPTMAHWARTEPGLRALGGAEYLSREWYERMRFDREGLTRLLDALKAESTPLITRMVSRYLAVTAQVLIKAFGYLAKRSGMAMSA